MRSAALALAVLLVACNQQLDPQVDRFGGPPPPTSYFAMRLDNALCLPRPLPESEPGDSRCRMIALLPGGACDASQDESHATQGDIAAIAAGLADAGETMDGTLCQVPQTVAGCASTRFAAWCYQGGSCVADAGNPCDQAVCISAGFPAAVPPGTRVWLACP